MSYGRNRSPYRVPCSGSVVDCIPGAKYQHSNGSAVPLYANVTTVRKSHDDGSAITAFTRRANILNPCSFTYPSCTDADLYCDEYVARHLNACPSADSTHATRENNCFNIGSDVTLQKCRQVGFQNLLIRHPWHGTYGPMSGHWQAPTDFCYEDVEDVGTSISVTCSIIPERTSADQTHYLKVDALFDWEWESPCEGIANGSTTYHVGVTVDEYSGERTVTDCEMPDFSHPGDILFLMDFPASAADCATIAQWNVADVTARYLSKLSTLLAAAGLDGGLTTVTRSGFTWTAEHDYSGTIRTAWTLTMDPAGGSFSYYKYDWINSGCSYDVPLGDPDLSWDVSQSEVITITTTGLSYAATAANNQVDAAASSSVSGTITYSDAFTVTQHRVLWDALRDQWNWDDFNQYPPRGWLIEDGVVANYDSRVTQAPIVQYSSPQASKSPLPVFGLLADKCTVADYTQPIGSVPYAEWEQRDWFDPDIYRWTYSADGDTNTTAAASGLEQIYDGSIEGGPGFSGQDGFFNFRHRVMERCLDGGSGDYLTYLYGFGNWNPGSTSTGAVMAGHEGNPLFPKTATRWTNLEEEANGIPCKYLKWDGDVLFGMDYREIKLNFPSQDFARPYGKDRWSMVESSTGCITDVTGDAITVDFGTGTNTITTSDYVIVGGSEYPSGLYPVTAVAGDVITVGAKICDNQNTEASGNYLGKARFKDCPGFGGRLQIKAAVQAGADLTLELFESLDYVRTGDSVDITGDTIPTGTYTLTKVDGTHWKITATLSGTYGGSAWMTWHGGTPHASPYYWVDNKTKGDYCLAVWSGDLGEREYQERDRYIALYASGPGCSCMPSPGSAIRPGGSPRWVTDFSWTQHCLAVNPCSAQFMPMPDFPALQADGVYGNHWRAMVYQTMTELFWQAPHFDCSAYDPDFPDLIQWRMDSTGNAAGDCAKVNFEVAGEELVEVHYYPHYPLVEARLILPTSAPALPSGIDFASMPGCPTEIGWSDNLPNILATLWELLAKQCNCIAGGGELASDYVKYDLPCP